MINQKYVLYFFQYLMIYLNNLKKMKYKQLMYYKMYGKKKIELKEHEKNNYIRKKKPKTYEV